MTSEEDDLEPFEFRSDLYKRFLWAALLLILLIDAMSIPTHYANRFEMPFVMLVMVLVGISIRVGLLVVLLMKKGPIKTLVYVWGGLYIIGGSLGLLSGLLTSLADYLSSTDSGPIVGYIGSAFYLALGLLLVVPLRKCVVKVEK